MNELRKHPERGLTSCLRNAIALILAVSAFLYVPAAVAESRTFVIGWFSHATNSTDDDCPDGVHPEIELQYLENLKQLGYSESDIAEYRQKLFAGEDSDLFDIMAFRGRIDGEPVNPYSFPATVADPELSILRGKFAYGFDLDGNDDSPDDFIDPETGETGIDHQMYRALGCARSFRGTLEGRTSYWDWIWGQTKESQPAWVITVTADDFNADGKATIGLYRAVEHLRSNSDGTPRAHVAYRVDPDPRSHNQFEGKIENGTIHVTEHSNLRLLQNPLSAPEFVLSNTHLRMQIDSDGSARGFIGGYQPWEHVYFGFATTGAGGETTITGDIPGMYYLLRENADGAPDPETGINRTISTTYYFEAVPAYVVVPGDQPDINSDIRVKD